MMTMQAYSTHNRAGEITYRHLSGFTYEVTIRTCTDISDINNADREYMPIEWGHFIGPDGVTQDSIQRTSSDIVVPNSIKENYYVTTHTFPGTGVYKLYSEDPNRNAGVNNIPNSIDQVFSLSTFLYIYTDPLIGFNNSVQLLNPPKEDGCINQIWSHGVEAYDPDGDSLSFDLIACTGGNGLVVNGYLFPDEFPSTGQNGELDFDQQFGIVTWDSPGFGGLYNIAIRVSEYRFGILMGSVVRDMQINISPCSNQAPVNDSLPDICVVAGEDLVVQVSASDPDGDLLDLTVEGEIFEADDALFTDLNTNPATGTIQWTPDCDDIRLDPYLVYVRAEDDSDTPILSDNDGFAVTVIAPPVQGLIAEVQSGGTMILGWDTYVCSQATGFKIYRRLGSNPFTPNECQTGLPESEGYTLIATSTNDGSNSYLDEVVPFGNQVCYRVVACFDGGSESIVSEESCNIIEMVIPVMTHSSVGNTDFVSGRDTIRWLPPLDMDTLDTFTGPYSYRLYRALAQTGDFEEIFESPATLVLDIGSLEFVDEGLNTEEVQHNYKVDFINDGVAVSTSNSASSLFLQIAPGDEQVILSWNAQVPWMNTDFVIFRYDDTLDEFVEVGNTSDTEYVDTELVNNEEYCYLVRSEGSYSLSEFGSYFNYSQEVCVMPFDNTPPCSPMLTSHGECQSGNYELNWSFPEAGCADDVAGYFIYYSPSSDSELELLYEITDPTDFLLDEIEGDFYGCFAVAAYDSLSQRPDGSLANNLSELSNVICIESCPVYELPNVFTPNGDGMNDQFAPFLPIAYVDSVEFKVFNRWGNIVFETSNPLINWKGDNKDSGELVSDGVYYYTITIYEKTLGGLLPRKQADYIHLFDNRKTSVE